MSQPKRHHFVPRMLLKNFTNNDDKLFVFNRNNPSDIPETVPYSVFYEKYCYAITDYDGNRDLSVELKLAQLEAQADPIVQKIIKAARSQQAPKLSKEDRKIWDEFVYLQWKRTPDFLSTTNFIQDFDKFVDGYLEMVEDKHGPIPPAEREKFDDPEERKRIKKNIQVAAIDQTGKEVLDAFSSHGIEVVVIQDRKSFVIGSNPICSIYSNAQKGIENTPIGSWLPIASDVAVKHINSESGQQLAWKHVSLRTGMETKDIRSINEKLCNQSTMIGARSRELISSLTRHKRQE